MENTLENKAKFFAQYWGQRVLNYKGSVGLMQISAIGLKKSVAKLNWLELTPLSRISDEDAYRLSKIEYDFYTENHITRGKAIANWIEEQDTFSHCLPTFERSIHASDFLRSQGYALPYMGLSINDLIGYGWIKLVPEVD